MPYVYRGTQHDDDVETHPEPVIYAPWEQHGNQKLLDAAEEAYPHRSRKNTVRPATAGQHYRTTRHGKRITEDTLAKLEATARLIPLGVDRATILARAGWANETALRRAVERHHFEHLYQALPAPARRPGRPQGSGVGPKGPHLDTIRRLENLLDILEADPRITKEEALNRVGWLTADAFYKAARRTGRDHIIPIYQEHGQRLDPAHLVRAGSRFL